MSETYNRNVADLIEKRIGDHDRAVSMAIKVHALIATMPRLPEDVRDRIALALRGGGDSGDDAAA